MTAKVSKKGQIILPAALCEQDNIKPGQRFDIERIDRGEYRLTRRRSVPNQGLT